jgi:glycosyltransferase involved in cell wall biosynthesis
LSTVAIKCIAWTRYDRRPDLLAQHLGVKADFITHGQRGKLLRTPGRYVQQARHTWRLLQSDCPEVVFIQAPPVFAPLVVALYARQHGARYVIDGHTGAFLSPKWQWSRPLLRMAARGAVTTLVTNDYLKSIVEGWGARASILAFTPGQYPSGDAFPFESGNRFKVTVVSTYEIDEPLNVVFEAAQRLPDVTFYITGNPNYADPALLACKPPNCQLTGYLPYGQYIALLRGCDVVMDLTTRNHTLLMGAYEAISLGTPLIVSDWPVLRAYFSKGTVHTPNTADGIAEAVRRAQHNLPVLRREAPVLRDALQAEWDKRFGELQDLLRVTTPLQRTRRSMQPR